MNHKYIENAAKALAHLNSQDPAAAKQQALGYILRGMQAEAGMTMMPTSFGAQSQSYPRGVGSGASGSGVCTTFNRNFEFPCLDYERECALKQACFPSVLVDAGVIIETDFDSLCTFGQLLYNLKLLQGTGSKTTASVSGTPAGGTLVLPYVGPDVEVPQVGVAIRWSSAVQLANPVVLSIVTNGILSLPISPAGSTPRDRGVGGAIQVELPAMRNGGWIYLFGAYRSAAGMTDAQAQIILPGDAAEITISAASDDVTFSARPMGPFNTWTLDAVGILAAQLGVL